MRIFGHPIHPILVHFPIVFWITGSALDFLFWLDLVASPLLAVWSLGLGLAFGAIAIVPGFVDLLKIEERFAAKANMHAALMGTSWLLFLCSFLARFRGDALQSELPLWILIIDLIAVAALAAGGVFGGELVHKHGVTLKRDTED